MSRQLFDLRKAGGIPIVELYGTSGDSGRRILSIFRLAQHLRIVDTLPEAIVAAQALESVELH